MQYSPRNIKISCNNSGLTHYGGIFFFQEFLRVLQFRRLLARHLPDFRSHHDYRLSQMTLALMYPIILGLDRLENASLLRSDTTFHYLTGLPKSRIHRACAASCSMRRLSSDNSYIGLTISYWGSLSTAPSIAHV